MLEPAQLRHRLQLVLPAFAVWVTSYELVARYASQLPATDLTTALDRAIPFRAGWIWIYVLTYVIPFLAVLVVQDDQRVYRALWAVGLASCSAYVLYVLYPVSSPRPLPGQGFADQLVVIQQRLDYPANQLPSLHVANAWILYGTVVGERRARWFRAACFALAGAITLSTLVVKQHIVPDVLAGGVWGGAAYWASGSVYARLHASAPAGSGRLRRLQ